MPTSTSSARSSAAVVVSPIGTVAAGVHAAGVEPLLDAHHAHAGQVVAGQQRPLDGGGAAPPRQQREVEVDHRQHGEDVGLDDLPERDDHAELGALLAPRAITSSTVCDTVQPEFERGRLHRARRQSLPRVRDACRPG